MSENLFGSGRQGQAGRISRRSVLKNAAVFGAGAACLCMLPGCAHKEGANPAKKVAGLSQLPGGTPVKGGTFTVGVISGGEQENLFPGTSVGTPDFVRNFNLYSLLFYLGEKVNPLVPGLALSAEPNATATVWRFKLRDGVVWHDGKPFSADDVVYNFKTVWSNPSLNYASGLLAGLVDYIGVRKIDRLTVEVPLKSAAAQFPTLFAYFLFPLVQDGATPESTAKHPIGTGPFKFASFTPGKRSEFVANPDYWEEGKPHVDRLVVDSSFTDTTAIFNAMLNGDINLYPSLPLVTAREQLSSKKVQILQSPLAAQTYMFAMRVDKGQFADNRVREGFKYLVDRQAMINGAWSGFGEVAHDIMAPGTEYFASDLERRHDPDRARSLFKAAGVLGDTFVLPTTNFLPGMVESSTILAQQAKAAGIEVQVQTKSAATYFTPAGGFLSREFGYEVNQPYASLLAGYRSELTTGAPYPDTRWGDQSNGKAAQRLLERAIASTGSDSAGLWHQAQAQQFHEGGYLAWGNLPYVDAAANDVRGLTGGAGFSYDNWRLCDGWIAS